MQGKTRAGEAITDLINLKLANAFKNKQFNATIHSEIYQLIFNSLVEVLQQSDAKLTNDAMNFVAQTFYDNVQINGNQALDPNIFTKRAKLTDISTRELAFLVMLFTHNVVSELALSEIKRRN